MTMRPIKNDEQEPPGDEPTRATFDGGGGGGYDGTMNDRLTKLEASSTAVIRRLDRVEMRLEAVEARLDRVEARLDRVESLLIAIKDDLHNYRISNKHDIDNAIKWIVGMMLAMSMAGFTVMTFVLNNATPKVAPTQQPIVIYTSELPPARLVPPAK